MNTNKTKFAISGLVVILIIVFLTFFKNKNVGVELNAPYTNLKLSGTKDNNYQAGVKGEDLKTNNGDIKAHDKTGKGVEVKRAETKTGSIDLINESPSEGSGSPKP